MTTMEDSKFKRAVFTLFTTSKFLGTFPLDGLTEALYYKIFRGFPLAFQALFLLREGFLWYVQPGQSPWVPTTEGWYYKVFAFPPLIFVTASNAYQVFYHRNRLSQAFETMVDTERALEAKTAVSYEKASLGSKLLVFMMLMKAINLCGYQKCWAYDWSTIQSVDLMVHITCRLFLVVIQLQFATILYAMQDQVIAMTKVTCCGETHSGQPLTTPEIERFLCLYNRLCTSCSIINTAYTNQILGIIALDYINININIYHTVSYFSSIFNEEEPESVLWAVVRIMGFVQSAVVLLIIVGACSGLRRSVEDFNKALYRLIITDVNHELQYSEILCVHLDVARIPQFSACGFFHLNYEMIYSVCASNVTFTVLALQMF